MSEQWTDERIGEAAYAEFHLYADHVCPDGVKVKLRCTPTIYCADLMRKMRDDMQVTIDDLRAQLATAQQELVEARKTIAYHDVSKMSLTVSAEGRSATLQAATPVGLDFPDGPGWWAFEGYCGDNPDVAGVQDVLWVHNIALGIVINTFARVDKLKDYHGKFYRLHMPWDATPVAEGEGV